MTIENLTRNELFVLKHSINEKLGVYDLLSVSIDMFKQYLENDSIENELTDYDISQALQHVADNYDSGGFDYSRAMAWAATFLGVNCD